MKVKIQQRSVYHKFAEVEIEINKKDYQKYLNENTIDGKIYHHIDDYLLESEHLWVDKIDKAINKSEYKFGFGLGCGMNEEGQESELRYELENGNYKEGGHL